MAPLLRRGRSYSSSTLARRGEQLTQLALSIAMRNALPRGDLLRRDSNVVEERFYFGIVWFARRMHDVDRSYSSIAACAKATITAGLMFEVSAALNS